MKRKSLINHTILLISVVFAVNLIAVLYIKCGKNIYFWDDATYWDIARKLSRKEVSLVFWKDVYRSIAVEDYNYVAGVISSFYVKLFGESRLVYILGLVNTYLLPSYAMIYFLAKKIGNNPAVTAVISVLFCPVMLFLTLNGFVDMGGLVICFLCYLLYYSQNEKHAVLYGVFIGMLLVLLMIWRRWYAFFSVSFITAMVADCLLNGKRKLPAAATVLSSGALLIFCFRDFVFGKLLKDYGNLYAGYKFALSVDFKLVTRYFGILFLLLLLVGSIVVRIKKGEKRTAFMWVQMGVCFVMFVLTQTHGQQHLLLYVPSLAVLCIILLGYVSSKRMIAAVSAIAVLQSANTCVPRKQPAGISEIKHYAVIPDFSMLPKKRTDTLEILELKNKLDDIVEDGKTLGVLASSFVINEDIIKNVQASLGVKSKRENYIVSLPQVDSRDRDMSAFYNVNYILVVFPAQTHLAKENQTVVTEAVKSFEAYADFAAAYEEVTECETDINGMNIKLYKRIKEVGTEAVREFESRLYK